MGIDVAIPMHFLKPRSSNCDQEDRSEQGSETRAIRSGRGQRLAYSNSRSLPVFPPLPGESRGYKRQSCQQRLETAELQPGTSRKTASTGGDALVHRPTNMPTDMRWPTTRPRTFDLNSESHYIFSKVVPHAMTLPTRRIGPCFASVIYMTRQTIKTIGLCTHNEKKTKQTS